MRTIEILVAPDGKTQLQTRGFAGASCLAASRALEAALGRLASDRLTSEYYATESAAEHAPARAQ